MSRGPTRFLHFPLLPLLLVLLVLLVLLLPPVPAKITDQSQITAIKNLVRLVNKSLVDGGAGGLGSFARWNAADAANACFWDYDVSTYKLRRLLRSSLSISLFEYYNIDF